MSRNVVFTVSFTQHEALADENTQAEFEKYMEMCLLMSLEITNAVLSQHATNVKVQKVASSVNIRDVQP